MGKYKIENNLGECPVCGEDMSHSDDQRDYEMVAESYSCPDCRIIVTYTYKQHHPSYEELCQRPVMEVSQKELDRAMQAERMERDRGEMSIERF